MKIIVKKEGTLLDYLYNNLDMSKKKVKSYLTHGSIYLNKNKTTQFDTKVFPKDEIIIDTNKTNSGNLLFDVLYEDEYIIVVNKPSGLLTIATTKEKDKTLYHLVGEYLRVKNKFAKVFIVHRLDKDTSGVVLLAKDEKTKNMLQKDWNKLVKLREYTAIVHGNLKNSEGRYVDKLMETKTNLVYITKKEDGKEAITNYKVLKENDKYSSVMINLETGRKNQIRVQFAAYGNPIVGDKKYGVKDGESRLYLHANRLKIFYPVIKKDILFETAIPSNFKKFVK